MTQIPQEIQNFISQKIEMANMTLPWNYPSIENFNKFQSGYRFNANTLESLIGQQGEFEENWFVICSNYFDDPFFIDVSEMDKGFPIYYAEHGAGSWTPIKVSAHINQFLTQLKELKALENDKVSLLQKLKDEYDLENQLWKEVYESILEDEEE